MPNSFYNNTSTPQPNSAGSSSLIRAEFASIAAGFNKLPTLLGNENKVVVVNGSGTGLEGTTNIGGITLTSSAFNGTVGATTPSTGAFTTLSATGAVTANSDRAYRATATGNQFIWGALTGTGNWQLTEVSVDSPITITGGAGGSIALARPVAVTGTLSATGQITTSTDIQLDVNNKFIYARDSGGTVRQMLGYTSSNVATLSAASGHTAAMSVGGTAIATASGTGLAVTGDLSNTGNVTLGDASTDTVTVNGYMGVGGAAPNANRAVNVAISAGPTATTGVHGVYSSPTRTSAGNDTNFAAYTALPAINAAALTVTSSDGLYINNATLTAGTLTNQYGVRVADLTSGTNNYGITSAVSSGTNKWNIYASGTAANYFAGRVLIGTPAGRAYGGFGAGGFQYETAIGSAMQTLISNRNDTGASVFGFGKSRGTVIDAVTAVSSGDPLGTFNWSGADGTALIPAASVVGTVDAAVSTGIVPGRLTFSTANTSGTLTERLRIDSAGAVQQTGSLGNFTLASTGNRATFSRDGANYINAAGASASINYAAPTHTFYAANESTVYGTFSSTGLAVTGSVTAGSIELGYRDVPANSQGASYTLALTDRGKSIDFTGSTAQTITVPANASVAFPVGSTITVTNTTANSLQIAITTDTMRQAGTANIGTRTLGQYGVATLRKVASTVWIIGGSGLT